MPHAAAPGTPTEMQVAALRDDVAKLQGDMRRVMEGVGDLLRMVGTQQQQSSSSSANAETRPEKRGVTCKPPAIGSLRDSLSELLAEVHACHASRSTLIISGSVRSASRMASAAGWYHLLSLPCAFAQHCGHKL